TPPSDLGTNADTFTYIVTSNAGATATATVTLHIGNRAPTAGADTMSRLRGHDGSISLANLLANDSDPDGDPISFVGVASTSAQGATLSVDNGFDIDLRPF